MDIYDSRYFNINKKLFTIVGLWPYDTQKKKILIRCYAITYVLIMAVPHLLGGRKNFGKDLTKFFNNVSVLLYVIVISLKLLITAQAEKKFKLMYDDIKKNWETITEENERKTLIEYSERGRMLTIFYIVIMSNSLVLYISLPLGPMFLDIVMPLNESRPHIYILDGEYLVNSEEHFGKIYVIEAVTCCLLVLIFVAVDTMFVACTEHCIGLFAIIKYRLELPNKLIIKDDSKDKDESYQWLIDTIKYHKKILKFTNTLESTYSTSFLINMGIYVVYCSILAYLLLVNLGVPENLIRYVGLLLGTKIHLFYMFLPGQKLIDHSTGLFRDAYCNEWYAGSVKSKRLLRFFMLRCSAPCLLTAGGLVNMNLENFLMILRKSLSYITVFSSMR